ncbi:phosphomannomutase/phosphoglucomutase [Caloramator sp. E03]|uniref:phosphomannomutase/phosphoglucomutase n=1 Tax=Caloramator sp. E03 TaxID=2576307 RepID=UPI00111080C9|nr:phosphomannomutase/phosphoglucomutase [Caloramator sp. E03]QCX34438.1 phosphomannomutase/phosphoglucomutase [Caloramator sp. E03]
MNQDLRKLMNGTDIRGVALTNKEGINVTLDKDIVNLLSTAFSVWVSEKCNKNTDELKIAVGMDSRLSGPDLKDAAIDGLCKTNALVYDCGLSSTPSMFMTTIFDEFKCDGSIMITASHLPYMYNGMKFFTIDGGINKEDLEKIIEIATDIYNNKKFENITYSKNVVAKDLLDIYSDHLYNVIIKDFKDDLNKAQLLKGSKIIVDAGNGVGGFFAHKVLKRLGADIEGSQYLEPDGNFPGHIPNPESKEAIASIKEAVLKSKADLGIIFDTDVDRAAIIDERGNEINRNNLIALLSAIVLEENPNSTIVTDSVTSNGLTKFIEEDLKGKHHRFKRGYRNVINEAIRLNESGEECCLAIETSGHAALKENYFLDDGAYLVCKIISKYIKLKKENKLLYDLIKNLKQPLESKEFRSQILSEDFKVIGKMIIDDLKEYCNTINGWNIVPKNYEGIRVNCDEEKGWFLLRMSLHEPLLVLNIESDVIGGCDIIKEKINNFLKKYEDTVKLF